MSKKRRINQARTEYDELLVRRDKILARRDEAIEDCLQFYIDAFMHDVPHDPIAREKAREVAKDSSEDYKTLTNNFEKELSTCEEKISRLKDEINDPEREQDGRKVSRIESKPNELIILDDPDDTEEEEEGPEDSEFMDYKEARKQIQCLEGSKLFVALQGLQRKSLDDRNDISDLKSPRSVEENLASMHCNGRLFERNKCYHYNPDNLKVIVGISKFIPQHNAATIVLVMPFGETFLGIQDEGVDYDARYEPSPYVQIEQELDSVLLADLGCVCEEVTTIPGLVYKPQVRGDWFHFAYYYEGERKLCGRRKGDRRVLDVFSGAGGMSEGLHRAGMTTVCAVEKNDKAAKAFKRNNPGARVESDVVAFLDRCEGDKKLVQELRADHLHGSPPCQGFSDANINGGINDEQNNKLSLEFVRAVGVFCPVTATFENVPGMWKRKNHHYVKRILEELMKLGYQVRCCLLKACDYGDPQARPRLFIVAARRCAYLPSLPTKRHGKGTLMNYVTVNDAIRGVSPDADESSHDLSKQEDRLNPNAPARTIRASSGFPLHPTLNRFITMDELKALFSLPPEFVLIGSEADQRRQLGNSVPAELAAAVGHEVMAVLKFSYEGESSPQPSDGL